MTKMKFFAAVVFMSGVVSAASGPAQYVNPFIGCADNGHTFPGACYPFGLVQPGPDTGNCTWRYCSGYMYLDDTIQGFSQTHISGTGCPDLGDVQLMPFTGFTERAEFPSKYRKETQKASPGYYAVTLDDFDVDVEITATPRVAFHRYVFRDPNPARLFLNLQHGIVSGEKGLVKRVLKCEEVLEDEKTLSGYIRAKCWVERDVYFVVRFDRPYVVRQIRREGNPDYKAPLYTFDFDLQKGEALQVKVAFSTVSVAQAKKNMDAEAPGWSFGEVREKAVAAWNEQLSRIVIDGTDDQKVNFYTSMYHLFIQPNNIADVDGQYRGADDKVATAGAGNAYYSTLSLWDTFRAAHQLYTIIQPERVNDFVNTMLAQQKAVGYLPVWTLWGKDNHCMIGNHSVPVIVDAYLKGFKGFDPEAALAAIKASLTGKFPGKPKIDWDSYDKYGYVPFDICKGESVSRTLEYSYDDWCAAELAKRLAKTEDEAFFRKRSENYRNLFDKETGFMRGRDTKGGWRTPFDPFLLGHGGDTPNDFTEGNSWQYTWHVLQNPGVFVELFGSREAFAKKLDALFKQPSKTDGQGFVLDVSGLIGQYAHGNEPSHHVAYLFQYADEGWRTQELVREICDKMYKNAPEGLCGNDDCGQMSAWYIFACMGFYPVNPCGGEYIFGAPQLPKMTVSLPGGKTFTIVARNFSKENLYVKRILLNGKEVKGFKLSHADVVAGGELVYEMGNTK